MPLARFLNAVWPYIFLLCVSSVLYWPTLDFEFMTLWDDRVYVLENPWIREFSVENLWAILTQVYFAHYTPLHLLSYSLDHFFWGLNPRGYHLSNLLLFGVTSCILFMLLCRLFGSRSIALAVALIFVVHPINVENVAWVSERKTILAALFGLSAFLAYLRFRDNGSALAYLSAMSLFVAALLSKPIMVVFPVLLFAHEWLLQSEPRRWLPLAPPFVVSLMATGLAVWAQFDSGVSGANYLTPEFLLGKAWPTMPPIYWKYWSLLLWPAGLNAFYDAPIYESFLAPPVAFSVLAWVLLTVVVILKGTPLVKFWYCWFWIWLLPVSNIVPMPVFYADRYMFLPAIGVYAIWVMTGSWMARELVKFIQSRFSSPTKPRRRAQMTTVAGISMVLIVSAALAGTTAARVQVWRNDLALWEDTAAKSPYIYSARLNLGVAYQNLGRLAEAEREYEAAFSIFPTAEAAANLKMVQAMRQSEKSDRSNAPLEDQH